MKTLFKSLLIITLFIGGTSLTVLARNLPSDAQRELDDLNKFIKKEKRETEKRILEKKKQAIRSLERFEKTIKNDFAKNLLKIQLVKYRNEVKKAEKLLSGDEDQRGKGGDKEWDKDRNKEARDAARIIDFNRSYFYRHPVDEWKKQQGELKFYTNGVVNAYHREGETVHMFKKWKWKIKGSKIEITADGYHGPIYVTKKSPKEIYLDWKGMINKKNVAKQK